ncbi:enoyl-CoA hydratase/isomerase family protein [Pseudonocardia kujensis]|uniref:enoyl-CoA hydratase/isomerase family protein n=1 Tax=Pseudonocardia kujensis TaxID=1128675 RepID=UPI001E557DE0|nr:enoyl-CoA hydratase/isomerase family protein [Pseudonocardia kujensis]MCE0764099.1 enoyl-CoA hydratase/isomerase family protein [Pseudonocardia kujensis]
MEDERDGRPRAVELRMRGPVAWVTLNRPEQLNAFSATLIGDLDAALERIDADPGCRVVVVTGAGRAFSAGGDLTEFRQHLESGNPEALVAFVDRAAQTLRRLEESPRPVIAAVNGAAVAGGLELILCCDIVLAAAGVRIGDGHLRYGVLPGGGGAARLTKKVPVNVAHRLLLTGDLEPAERFRDWGLVDSVVPGGELLEQAAALAERIAGLSPLALAEVKRVAREASTLPAAEGLKLELDAFAGYVRSHDLREGMQAFRERRAPRFRGC